MKFKVIACGVFEPYLRQLAAEASNEIEFKALDAGLHSRPNDLRLQVQAEIDTASSAGGHDAVILLYGLCGRGTANLVSRDIPVVIARVHDCVSLFLGSGEAYLRQFHKNPGTFYHTLGWIEQKTNPKNREATELYSNYQKEGFDRHPDFEELRARFGEEDAEHIVQFKERWRQHYTRAAYIKMGFGSEDKSIDFTREMAEIFEWNHEVIEGDPSLIRHVLSGDWSDDRVFVLPPNNRSITSGDERIFSAVAIDSTESDCALSDAEIIVESGGEGGESVGIGLGIDAGGTYTDAVIYDLGERKLLAKAKAITTYHDLLEGIRNALAQLPAGLLSEVQVTSLSTTLATNSMVEGRGYKVGLIVLAPWDWFGDQIGHKPCIRVPGSTSITGDVIEPLDEFACCKAVDQLVKREKCAAIVVAGYASVRNPDLENRVRELVLETHDVPVICSHEISQRLNAVNGAHTAVANAKLLPTIRDLIDSVHKALADFSVPGKLMVVKGDGTPVDESIARARPVETILSGPAASVSGAHLLTGLDDALVLDIGGTTTDCAVIENGRVAVSPEGARVGSSVMSIDLVDICTVGLGGDSRIDFTPDRHITVGPVRNIPIAYTAAQSSSVEDFIKSLDKYAYVGAYDASALDILVPGGNGSLDLTNQERSLLDLLRDGPVPAVRAAAALKVPHLSLLPTTRLESCGMVKRSALTPTDLLHVTGRFTRWNTDAARRALEVFSAMFGRSPDEVLELASRAVTRRLFEEILRREVSWENRKLHDLPKQWDFLLDKAFNDDGVGLGIDIFIRRPIIAIGAPAEALVTAVSNHLRAEIVVPEHADVANAVGAIGSEIVVREEILIRPGHMSNYVLHGSEEHIEFTELDRATARAIEISRVRARARAIDAGAAAPEVTISRVDRLGSASDGGKVFLERHVTAVASGGAFRRL